MKLSNILCSGWEFSNTQLTLKSRFEMVNLGIILSTIALSYGVIGNVVREHFLFVPFELTLITLNILFFFLLRKSQKYFEGIVFAMTLEFSSFLLFLIYKGDPNDLRHIWLFIYPVVLLYFQGTQRGRYWFGLVLIALMIAPLQPWIEVSYSLYQVTYLAFVLVMMSILVFFYYEKMQEANRVILEQQSRLESKVKELEHKDELLTQQSKQAVMGEMITMIAHQWRQPLSTITLQISNLQIKRLLEDGYQERESDHILDEINQTIIYLSNTIDDFQTYFHPKKECIDVKLDNLFQRVINFTTPRLKGTKIKLKVEKEYDISLKIYESELIQVLLNIVNNAVDALKEGEFSDPKITIRVEEENKNIAIIVNDNANGIAPDVIPHLFEPYFSTKGRNGTGLGLYMSQMIIEKQFGGKIEVESSEYGATFKVIIPKRV